MIKNIRWYYVRSNIVLVWPVSILYFLRRRQVRKSIAPIVRRLYSRKMLQSFGIWTRFDKFQEDLISTEVQFAAQWNKWINKNYEIRSWSNGLLNKTNKIFQQYVRRIRKLLTYKNIFGICPLWLSIMNCRPKRKKSTSLSLKFKRKIMQKLILSLRRRRKNISIFLCVFFQ